MKTSQAFQILVPAHLGPAQDDDGDDVAGQTEGADAHQQHAGHEEVEEVGEDGLQGRRRRCPKERKERPIHPIVVPAFCTVAVPLVLYLP